MATKQTEITVDQITKFEDIHAPTLFVDGIHGLAVVDGTVRINLTQMFAPLPSPSAPQLGDRVIARLAIPATAFARIAEFIAAQYAELVASGSVPKFDAATGQYTLGSQQKDQEDV